MSNNLQDVLIIAMLLNTIIINVRIQFMEDEIKEIKKGN